MALKHISPSQVELGMFIHSFQGNWLAHPFWRAKFLLNDDERLQAVRDSALNAVVIDTDRGRDVADVQAPVAERALGHRTVARPAPAPPAFMRAAAGNPFAAAQRSPSAGTFKEFGNARRAAGAGRKVISKLFIEARLGKAPRVAEVTPVVEEIHASIERNPHAFSGLMRCKMDMAPIYQHMLSVSALMISLARQMGLPPHESRIAGMAGLLLDVGVAKLDIDPADFANGLDRIDQDEWHKHCYVGRDMLASADDVPEEVLQIVTRHHELMDGTGFPQGLEARQIDNLSRMAAICDTFDLLVSGASSGQFIDPAEAMRMMMGMESSFDMEILGRFREALGVWPVGSFVILRSGRVAMVVDQDRSDSGLPTVHAFHSAITGKPAKPRTIELASCFGTDAIHGAADPEELGLGSPQELRAKIFASLERTS
jgi:HD-GYP domain